MSNYDTETSQCQITTPRPQIPADIQARLDVIERETAITSCEVRKPSRFAFFLWVIYAIVIGYSFMEFKKENFGLTGLLVAISGFQIAFYFHERKLFALYLNACEIIKYYRTLESKPQPGDTPTPHSPSAQGPLGADVGAKENNEHSP